MNAVLNRNLFFVKEHIGMFKAANNYDILDPETQEIIMLCREENLGFFTKMLRFTDYKRMTPFNIEISTPNGELLLMVKRGVSLFRSMVEVLDSNGIVIGTFRQRMLSLGGKFDLLDLNGNVLCTLRGDWKGWEFTFVKDEIELASVSKKWAGLGKELFTTADNYMLKIESFVKPNDPMRMSIVAMVMCIDMVLKE
jgi:uncharacterized protein YxjI